MYVKEWRKGATVMNFATRLSVLQWTVFKEVEADMGQICGGVTKD